MPHSDPSSASPPRCSPSLQDDDLTGSSAIRALAGYWLDINDLKADRLIEKFSDLETTFDEIKPSIRAKAREFLEVLDEQYRFIFNDMSPKESNN